MIGQAPTTEDEDNLVKKTLDKSLIEQESQIPNQAIYPGLNPYSEAQAAYFFGRYEDIQEIITYLFAKPLIILHGESGVGKSSILQAGVIYNINKEIEENLKYDKVPKLAIVIFNNWKNQKNLSAELLDKIKQEVGDLNGQVQLLDIKDDFTKNLKDWVKYLNKEGKSGNIFIILDQFEEYLFQSPDKDFENNLISCLNDPDLQSYVHFLISLRSDAVTLIDDHFKGRLRGRDDDPLSNRIALKHLNSQSARDAIIEPIKIYNQQHKEQELEVGEPDDELVEEVLDGVKINEHLNEHLNEDLIEAPLLQLVMKSLWDKVIDEFKKDKKAKTKPKLEKKLLDELAKQLEKKFGKQFKDGKDKKPVELIAQNHLRTRYLELEKQLKELNKELNEVTKINKIEDIIALIFYHLVTPTGEKIAYNIDGLVRHFNDSCKHYKLQLTESQGKVIVEKIVETLSEPHYRVLRPLGNKKYEIFHNTFCKLIYEWVEQDKNKLDRNLIIQEQNQINTLLQNLAFQSIQKNQSGEYDLSIRLACTAYAIAECKKIPVPRQVDQTLRELLTPRHFSTSNLFTCNKEVSSVAFSPGGNWLACGSYDGTVRVWNYGQILKTPNLTLHGQDDEGIASVALTDDGKLAAGGQNGTVYFVNLNELPQELPQNLNKLSSSKHEKEDEKEVRAVAFSPDGNWLASGSWDKTVKVWDLSKPEVKFCSYPHKDWIWSVAFHPKNNHILAAGCRNGSVQLWDISDSTSISPIKTLSIHSQEDWEDSTPDILQENEIFAVAFSPDGKTLAAGGRNQIIYLWNINLATGNLQVADQPDKKMEGHKNQVRSLSFSPDSNSKILASGSDDMTIKFWDYESGLCRITRKQHELGVSAIAFSPRDSGKELVSGSWDKQVLVWQYRKYKTPVKNLTGHKNLVKSLAFADDRCLVSGSYDKTVKKWDLGNDKVGEQDFVFSEILPEDLSGQEKEVRTIACSPDGKWLASGGVQGVLLWDRRQLNFLPISLDTEDTRVVAFSCNNELLAAASFNDQNKQAKIKLWQVKDQSLLHSFEMPKTRDDKRIIRTIAFDAQSGWLVAGGDEGKLWIWNCHAPSEPPQTGPIGGSEEISKSEEINSVAFSPDSQWLAAATEADSIYLYKVNKDSQLLPISKAEFYLIKNARGRTICFSPNSEKLATGDRSGVIRIWDLKSLDVEPIELEGQQHRINAIAFSPNSKILASASDDKTIYLWIVETEQLIKMARERVNQIKLSQEDWRAFIGKIIDYESNQYKEIDGIIAKLTQTSDREVEI